MTKLTDRLDIEILAKKWNNASHTTGVPKLPRLEDRVYHWPEFNQLIELFRDTIIPLQIANYAPSIRLSDAHTGVSPPRVMIAEFDNRQYKGDGNGMFFPSAILNRNKQNSIAKHAPQVIQDLVKHLQEYIGDKWEFGIFGSACDTCYLSLTSTERPHIYLTDTKYQDEYEKMCESVRHSMRYEDFDSDHDE